LTDWLDCP